MFYIRGDTHGDVSNIIRDSPWIRKLDYKEGDTLIILGDAGWNFHLDNRDEDRKRKLARECPFTLFCVHGNHECRPENLPSYHLAEWHGGKVWVEDRYPNILFAKDGEIYDINGAKTIVLGGAYSVDKQMRLLYNWPWWPDEQPSDEIKRYAEKKLAAEDWQIDAVLSHTIPQKFVKNIEDFVNPLKGSMRNPDKSTEEWLDTIENRLKYRRWYAGHWHLDMNIDRLQIMYDYIKPFEPLQYDMKK